jgi:hypothetical protein
MATSKRKTNEKTVTRQSSTSPKSTSRKAADPPESKEIFHRISERAYFKAQQRGFASGHELDDWYVAEKEQLAESGLSSKR